MSVELKSAKRLTALKNKIDAVTETPSNTLSESVDNVIAGYGQGGSGGGLDLFPYVRYVDFTADLQEVTKDIALHLERAPAINQMFSQATMINAPKITVYISDICENMSTFLRGNGRQEALKTVEIIGDTKQIKLFNFAFYWRITLETINCEFDFSSATNVDSMLTYCSALKEVRFKRNTLSLSISIAHSPNLSDASIDSIVNGLADLTGQTAQTITFHSTVTAKIMANVEWDSAITSKNWIYE